MFLTEDELVDLTGYRQAAKQAAHLKAQRIPFHVNRAGHPRVARAAVQLHIETPVREKTHWEVMAEFEQAKRDRIAARALKVAAKKLITEKNRPALVRHHCAKRRAATLRQSPAWADQDAIKAIYRQAKELTKATGVMHHVDHELPLKGEFVSGLHVHQNLQVLTARENVIKHNKFEVTV